jgi:hypothetical protein
VLGQDLLDGWVRQSSAHHRGILGVDRDRWGARLKGAQEAVGLGEHLWPGALWIRQGVEPPDQARILGESLHTALAHPVPSRTLGAQHEQI